MNLLLDVCKCGHRQELHTHLRKGSDCGVSRCNCNRFRKPGRWDWMTIGVWGCLPLALWVLLGCAAYGAFKIVQHFFL